MIHHDRQVIGGILDAFAEQGVHCQFHVVVPRDVASLPEIKWDHVLVDYDKFDAREAIERIQFKRLVAFTSKSYLNHFKHAYVYSDNDLIIDIAFYYFLKQGIEKVLFYTDEQDRGQPWTEGRYSSFKHKLEQFDLSAAQSDSSFKENSCVGILCSCDRSARKLIQILIDRGIYNINRMLVIGIDSDPFEKRLCPVDFPSIEQDKHALGKQIVACALNKGVTVERFQQYCLREASGEEKTQIESREVQFARLYFSAHLMHQVDIEEVSRQCHTSRKKLDRLFIREHGVTAHAYLRSMQLKKAKELLRESDLNIAIIASACGFEQSNYFYKVFRAHENSTPDAYRRRFSFYKEVASVTTKY